MSGEIQMSELKALSAVGFTLKAFRCYNCGVIHSTDAEVRQCSEEYEVYDE